MRRTDTVVGIEKLGMRHISLQCDTCAASYDGGNGKDKPGPYMPGGYQANQEQLLQADARALGWTGSLMRNSDHDRCPTCTEKYGPSIYPPIVPVVVSVTASAVTIVYNKKKGGLQEYLIKAESDVEVTFAGLPDATHFTQPYPGIRLHVEAGTNPINVSFSQLLQIRGDHLPISIDIGEIDIFDAIYYNHQIFLDVAVKGPIK